MSPAPSPRALATAIAAQRKKLARLDERLDRIVRLLDGFYPDVDFETGRLRRSGLLKSEEEE